MKFEQKAEMVTEALSCIGQDNSSVLNTVNFHRRRNRQQPFGYDKICIILELLAMHGRIRKIIRHKACNLYAVS